MRHSAEVSADALFDALIRAMWASSMTSSSNSQGCTSGDPSSTSRRRSTIDPYGVSTEPVSAVVAKGLVSFTWRRFPWLHPGEQHDAQEFLRCFLNELHDALKTVDMRSMMGGEAGGDGNAPHAEDRRHRKVKKKKRRANCCKKQGQVVHFSNTRAADRAKLKELAEELLGKFFLFKKN